MCPSAHTIQAHTYVRTYVRSCSVIQSIQRDTSLLMAFLGTAPYLQCKHIICACKDWQESRGNREKRLIVQEPTFHRPNVDWRSDLLLYEDKIVGARKSSKAHETSIHMMQKQLLCYGVLWGASQEAFVTLAISPPPFFVNLAALCHLHPARPVPLMSFASS